jgi:hypothetical protein
MMSWKHWFLLLLAAFYSACGDDAQGSLDASIENEDAHRNEPDATLDGGADAPVDAGAEPVMETGSNTDGTPDGGAAIGPVHEPVIGCAPAELPATASFEILPALIAGDAATSAWGMSANGAVVVGDSVIDAAGEVEHPVVWKDGTAIDLFEPGDSSGFANAANCDGSVVLANTEMVVLSGTHAIRKGYRWSAATGLRPLPGAQSTGAGNLSGDARVIVGAVANPEGFPPYWFGAMWIDEDLTMLPPDVELGPLSADGNVAIGVLGFSQIVRWTPASGVSALFKSTRLADLSADGSTILLSDKKRWTDELGFQAVPCTKLCQSVAISSTGKIVAIDSSEGHEYMELWDVKHGTRPLAALLAEYGASFGDWKISLLVEMSDDGRVFVGNARNSAGTYRAFRATLPQAAYE